MFAVMIGRQIDIVPTEIHILVKGRSGDMPINTHITPPITENERIATGLQSGKRGKMTKHD